MKVSSALALSALLLAPMRAVADQASPTPAPSISPSPPAKLLDTVVVTAERRPTTIRSTSHETYVITLADLDALRAPTIAEALSFVPGLYVKRNGAFGGVESVLARGASSEQTLVLIDGRPAGDADLGDFDLSSIATDAVSRVEVVEGGASTLYGSSAVGGVINIITAAPGSVPSASAYEQYGFEGANATGVRADAGDLRTLAATVDVRSSHARDEFDYPAFLSQPAGTRTDDDAKVDDVTVGLGHRFGGVTGTLRLNDDANDFGAPGDLEFCAPPPSSAGCPSGLAREQRVWGRSEADFAWQSGTHALSVEGYADGRRLIFFDRAPSFPYNTLTTLTTRGASVRDVWTAGASNVIVAGIDTRGDRASFGASYYAAPTIARDASSAWYVEDDHRAPASSLSISAGLRREHPQGTNAVTVPSFGVDERLGTTGTLRANYARAFRTPTLDERYFPFFGTPTLQPEYGATFDVGMSREIGSGLASVTYFGADTNNLIIDVPIDSFGDVAPENVARARVRGYDAAFRAPLQGGYAVSISYTGYPQARDLTARTRLLYRPTATGSVALEHDARLGSLGIDLRYVGERYADEAERTLLPQFASVGAFARRSLGSDTSLSLRLDNITGERVPESFDYPVTGPTLSVTLSQSFSK